LILPPLARAKRKTLLTRSEGPLIFDDVLVTPIVSTTISGRR
jgi:hypothetical protein